MTNAQIRVAFDGLRAVHNETLRRPRLLDEERRPRRRKHWVNR